MSSETTSASSLTPSPDRRLFISQDSEMLTPSEIGLLKRETSAYLDWLREEYRKNPALPAETIPA